jgi:hypothetical protein
MKKLFEPGNKAAVGHGRPKLHAEARQKALEILGGVDHWGWQLASKDESIRQRAVFKLWEYGYGKPQESIDLTTNGDPIRFGGDEGRAAIAAMLEGLRLPAKPKAIEAKAVATGEKPN